MKDKIKVIAVDNHDLILQGYKGVLNNNAKYELMGIAYNGKELIEMLPFKEPDIIILDLEMPIMNGDEALKIIMKRFPKIKVLISSMHYGIALVAHYAKAGAYGYLPKDRSEKLIEALDYLSSDKFYFDLLVSKEIISEYEQLEKLKSLNITALDETEETILKLICMNKKNREIAEKLNLSIHTVDSKRRNIYEKIKLSDLPDLIKYALKNGIIDLD